MKITEPQLLGMVVALGLGMLVGLQREWVAGKRIGLRSFALISTIGGLVGLFTQEYGGWILAAGLIAITIGVFTHNYLAATRGEGTGMTTELAALAVFLIGALATSGYLVLAVVLGGGVTLLLHWKTPMHTWVSRVGEVEFEAIGRFVLITLVVLPILPNENFGPFAVLNPWQIWLMVVLIVGINLAGYLSYKIASGKGGALVNGVLGGLVSSTATTVSFSRRSRHSAAIAPLGAIVILVASAFVYVRLLIEVSVAASGLLPQIIWPIVAFASLFVLVVVVQIVRFRPPEHAEIDASNPAELTTALTFGLLYSAVLFVSAAVDDFFGETMLYPVALISGLTDVDAITLSICRLFSESRIDGDTAWRVIFVASLSNLVFKTGIVAVFGGREIRRSLLPALIGLAVIGFTGVVLWP